MYYHQLGYDTYSEYLEGEDWQKIHEFFYENIKPYKCRVCGKNRNLVLHKRTYERLTLDQFKRWFRVDRRTLKHAMVWLCKSCNSRVHFYDNGTKVPLVYRDLMAREQVVYKRYHSIWNKIRHLHPHDILDALANKFA